MAESRREVRYRFEQRRRARKPDSATARSQPRGAALPRITRLMALALKLDGRLRESADLDRRALAHFGRVSRSRITQILNLLQLAPDIQERLLSLPPIERGREIITESAIRPLTAEYDWQLQRARFEQLLRRRAGSQQREAEAEG